MAHSWKPGYFRLFVSHISKRKDVAGALRKGLGTSPHRRVRRARHHRTYGRLGEDEIEDALATCDACAAILTDGSPEESDWCDQEVGVCFGRGVLVLAINDGLNPYGFIGKFQAFNPLKYKDNDSLWQAIYELLRDNHRSREAMAEALVHQFEHSGSFDAARSNMDRLKGAPAEAWPEPLLARIEKAHEKNIQIRGELLLAASSAGGGTETR